MNLYAGTRKFSLRMSYRLARLRERAAGNLDRPRIVFVHTPKTGGTSINSYFKEHVGSKRSRLFARYEDHVSQELDEFAAHVRPAKFVTGHMPWAAFERCCGGNVFGFTILRDPYDRLRSLYHYMVNIPPGHGRGDELDHMQRMSLPEFLSSPDKRVRFYTDNYFARQFSGSLDGLAETSVERLRLVEPAIRNLSSLDLIGFNDDMDSAFAEVARKAGLPPPPTGRRRNVTADLIASQEKKVEATRGLNSEMRRLARPLVEADLMIYEHFLQRRAGNKLQAAD
ncbi:MAG TPA: sulfotransferase family 2 domain-containing protein [Parvibaculum sp.]|jgi:hypothetical protein